MGRRSKQRKRKHEEVEVEVEVEVEHEVEEQKHEHEHEQLIPSDFIPVARLSKEQTEYSKNLLEIISNETEVSFEFEFEPILKELEGREESYMCDYYGSLLMKELIRKISNSKSNNNNNNKKKKKYIKDLLERLNLRNLLLNVHACKVMEEILLTLNSEEDKDKEEIIQLIMKSLSKQQQQQQQEESLGDTLLFYSKQKFSVHFIRLLIQKLPQNSPILTIFRRKDLIFHPFASLIVQDLMDLELLKDLSSETDLYEISLNPIASFYLQKWLEQEHQEHLLIESFPYDKLYPISMNQYGNYIVQKLLERISSTTTTTTTTEKDLVAKYLLNKEAIVNLLKNDRLNVVYKLTTLFSSYTAESTTTTTTTESKYSDLMFELIVDESKNCILLQCALLKYYKQYESSFLEEIVLNHPEYANKREESHLITTYFLHARDKRRTKREFARRILSNFSIKDLAMDKYGSRVLESFVKSGCLEIKDLQEICCSLLKSKATLLSSVNARKVYETFGVELYGSDKKEWKEMLQQSQQQSFDDEELKRKFLEIEEAYTPSNSTTTTTTTSYRFIHPFYNLVSQEEAQTYSHQKVSSSSSSNGLLSGVRIPESKYNESQQMNPDPQCFIPVFATSVDDIKKRLHYQQQEVQQKQRIRLEELKSVELQQLQITNKLELWKRFDKLRMEQSRLRIRMYSLFCLLQSTRMRSNSFELKREEEEFKKRLMELNLLLKSVLKDKLQQSQLKLNNLNSSFNVKEEEEVVVVDSDELLLNQSLQLNSSVELIKKKLKEKSLFLEEIKREYVLSSGVLVGNK
ncbi:hypothetical protein MP638_002626 [Amoeboaphelidium occidentale]|nr:hypothetical protein MP638_002626 [Amoeboaphelidium occidentale]